MKMRRLIKDRQKKNWEKDWKYSFFFCACELVNRHKVKKKSHKKCEEN